MIGGTLNRKPKRSSMVRVAVVSFVLLAGLVMVGAIEAAAGAEDKDGLGTSVLTTIVEEVRPVPVAAPRKLSKKSKASQDDGVSKEVDRLLRLLVYQTSVDQYDFSTQPARSLAEVEIAAARVNTNENGRGLFFIPINLRCQACLVYFAWATQLTSEEQEEFCDAVVSVLDPDSSLKATLTFYCNAIVQCPNTNPNLRQCCLFEGQCFN